MEFSNSSWVVQIDMKEGRTLALRFKIKSKRRAIKPLYLGDLISLMEGYIVVAYMLQNYEDETGTHRGRCRCQVRFSLLELFFLSLCLLLLFLSMTRTLSRSFSSPHILKTLATTLWNQLDWYFRGIGWVEIRLSSLSTTSFVSCYIDWDIRPWLVW